MSLRAIQIGWEIVAHTVSGAILLLYILHPSFQYVTVFLIAEYLVGVVNTVCWIRWVDKAERHPSPATRGALD